MPRIAVEEMSWEASENPASRPVSCCGKRPLGTMIANQTVTPKVASVSTSMSPE